MAVKCGDKLPNVYVHENTPDSKVNISQLAAGKKVVILGVPGAFTPCCSKTHVPSFISDYDKYKSKGVDEIICIAVNDPYVMDAWGKDLNAEGKVRMLADTNGAFTKAMGLEKDFTDSLGTIRCKRFSLYAEDGEIKKLCVEPDGNSVTCSKSENLLSQL
ncbi:peroxiredoxin-5, mitochondrial-like [Daphnia carinata]|uniref:peroxiredoxin-5, mitochondrial-like n=1 Tax=Daphnia carinata TaxID=120202 RepID=UPI00257E23C3|nr:peroxiredoxin-5, mitochondrial-like [Daphnia carinata]